MAKKINMCDTSQIDSGTVFDCSACGAEIIEAQSMDFNFCPMCGEKFSEK